MKTMRDWIDVELEAWSFIDKLEKGFYAYVETAACKRAWIDRNGELYGDRKYADAFIDIDAAKAALKRAETLCNGFGNKILREVVVQGKKEINLL